MNLEITEDIYERQVRLAQIEFEKRLSTMSRQCRGFENKWAEWAQPKMDGGLMCNVHNHRRAVDYGRSVLESWTRKEFVMIYKVCPGCLKAAGDSKPTKKRKQTSK